MPTRHQQVASSIIDLRTNIISAIAALDPGDFQVSLIALLQMK
jgi:hypothetical protein